MAGFVHINPLPDVQGLGSYQIKQMPRRVLEGNKVPYGPMIAQRVYPYQWDKRMDSVYGPVIPMSKLGPSPIRPIVENRGTVLAGPVTFPRQAYVGDVLKSNGLGALPSSPLFYIAGISALVIMLGMFKKK